MACREGCQPQGIIISLSFTLLFEAETRNDCFDLMPFFTFLFAFRKEKNKTNQQQKTPPSGDTKLPKLRITCKQQRQITQHIGIEASGLYPEPAFSTGISCTPLPWCLLQENCSYCLLSLLWHKINRAIWSQFEQLNTSGYSWERFQEGGQGGSKELCVVQPNLCTGRRCRRAPSNHIACSQGKLPLVKMLKPAQEQWKPQGRELRSVILRAGVAGTPLCVRSPSTDLWSSSSNPSPPVCQWLLDFICYESDVFFFFLILSAHTSLALHNANYDLILAVGQIYIWFSHHLCLKGVT